MLTAHPVLSFLPKQLAIMAGMCTLLNELFYLRRLARRGAARSVADFNFLIRGSVVVFALFALFMLVDPPTSAVDPITGRVLFLLLLALAGLTFAALWRLRIRLSAIVRESPLAPRA